MCKSFLEHNYTFEVVNIGDYSHSSHKSFQYEFNMLCLPLDSDTCMRFQKQIVYTTWQA